jgi:hypothetical protein
VENFRGRVAAPQLEELGKEDQVVPLPVISNVYRVTFVWNTYAGITPRNVINLHDVLGTSNEDDVASATFSALPSHWAIVMPSGFRLLGFNVIKLDGSSAGIYHPVADTGGEQGTDTIPQAAALIKLHTSLRGQAHRGRIFLGPIAEGSQSGGILDATQKGTLQTAWSTFWSDLASGTPALTMGVASYHNSTFTALDVQPTVETKLGTQRRRMQQLRRFGGS